ncbi:50S ribosome-binding GTPase, partial [Candidatus Fermentibacteria bacterium]|nr:50S ribosome-binding GTPase [Candidatus Fermentibacteria bacterium]
QRILRILRDKLGTASSDRPLLAVVAGGTNVGKSTVCNLLAGMQVSTVSALARKTRSPVVCGAAPGDRSLLPGVRSMRVVGEAGSAEVDEPTVFITETPFPPTGCLLIDSPDMDSDYLPNQLWAWRLLDAADAVVLVVTPEKYHDAAVSDFLVEAAMLGRALVGVMNKSESAEAFEDFVRMVWRPVAADAPVVEIPRRLDLSGEGAPLREIVEGWCARARQIKAASLDGSARVLGRELEALTDLAAREQRWLAELHEGIGTALDEALHSYRRQISGERFEELDRVFRRLMREFRIPVVDDFYDGVRSVTTILAGRIRGLLGGSGDDKKAVQREREHQRIADVCQGLVVSLSRQMDAVPLALRSQSGPWRAAVPQCPDRAHLGSFLASAEHDVERWVADESAAIARTIGSKPGVRRSLVAMKSSLQIGAGVLGVVLTGGLDMSDLAIAPVVERLTAFLLERGLGYPYFARSRSRLMAVRTEALKRYLEALVSPLRAAIPQSDPELVRLLQQAATQVPGARELLQ